MDWEREEIFIDDDMMEILKDIQRSYLEDAEGSAPISLEWILRYAISDLWHKRNDERMIKNG